MIKQAAVRHIEGKVALITGSTSGIGEATAKLFGAAGYHVVVTGRNVERGERVATAAYSWVIL